MCTPSYRISWGVLRADMFTEAAWEIFPNIKLAPSVRISWRVLRADMFTEAAWEIVPK